MYLLMLVQSILIRQPPYTVFQVYIIYEEDIS